MKEENNNSEQRFVDLDWDKKTKKIILQKNDSVQNDSVNILLAALHL